MTGAATVPRRRRFVEAAILTAGQYSVLYNLVSWALNSFGVPLDDFLPRGGP